MKTKKLGAIFLIAGSFGLALWYFWGELRDGADVDKSGVSGTEDVAGGGEVAVPNLDAPVFADSVSATEQARLRPDIERIVAALNEDLTLYDSWLDLGSYRKLAGDYAGAEEIWLYMAANWPHDRAAYENLGDLYHLYIRDYPRAERYYRAALRRDDTYPALYMKFYELYALSWSEKKELADDILLEGLGKLPGHIGLLFTLAEYYASDGEHARAREYYRQVRTLAEQAGDSKMVERVDEAVAALGTGN
ncbi:MAG: hypothetical protein Q8R39_04160 [bacterium]|nr:hypothetical protein [bacterium]MDZ4284693.1 hypothetical protein [Patescibacteria group bacterium]